MSGNAEVGFVVFVSGAIWCLTICAFIVVISKEHKKLRKAESESQMWEKCARTAGARFLQEFPDGDYEHVRWCCHINRLELHLVRRSLEGAEQELFYCLHDSTHLPAKFKITRGEISPN